MKIREKVNWLNESERLKVSFCSKVMLAFMNKRCLPRRERLIKDLIEESNKRFCRLTDINVYKHVLDLVDFIAFTTLTPKQISWIPLSRRNNILEVGDGTRVNRPTGVDEDLEV